MLAEDLASNCLAKISFSINQPSQLSGRASLWDRFSATALKLHYTHRSSQMQCTLDVPIISGKPEVLPIISLW